MAPDKAKAPEKPGPSEDQPIAEADAGDESGSDSEAEVPAAASAKSGPSRPSKKKKKRSKVSLAISALKGDSSCRRSSSRESQGGARRGFPSCGRRDRAPAA
jgi:hypothetical protein